MIFIKNRGIIGILKRIIKAVFRVVYAVINLLGLQALLFTLLVGLVLYVTGIIPENKTVVIIFAVAIVLSIVFAVYLTVHRISKTVKKDNPSVKIITPTDVDSDLGQNQTEQRPPIVDEEKPRYFKVKENPNYLMAEYADRYELLLITKDGLKKVRVDYK